MLQKVALFYWDASPLLSTAVVGGIMAAVMFSPQKIANFEKDHPQTVRWLGVILAIIVVTGAISGYKQQTDMEKDIKKLPTSEYIEKNFIKLKEDIGNKVDKIPINTPYKFKGSDFAITANKTEIPFRTDSSIVKTPYDAPIVTGSRLQLYLINHSSKTISYYIVGMMVLDCKMKFDRDSAWTVGEWEFDSIQKTAYYFNSKNLERGGPISVNERYPLPDAIIDCPESKIENLFFQIQITDTHPLIYSAFWRTAP